MFKGHCIFRISLLIFLFLITSISKSIGAESVEGPGRSIPSQGNEHIASIGAPHDPYNSNPPTSGWHVGFVARWGIHSSPIPKELQVHNLEDGGVIIQYNCNNCDELVSKLTKIAKKYNRIVLAPYTDMKPLIALTAWGKIDELPEFDEKRIIRFVEAYIGVDHHPKKENLPTPPLK
ncbi:MAG TPA: DUF3105 domain-containing protein [Nitrospiria bacterium]|jgi:hypothetical protein